MTVNFETVIFPTVEAPNYDKKKARWSAVISLGTVVLFFAAPFLVPSDNVYIYFAIISFIPVLLFCSYRIQKSTYLKFTNNGSLTIDGDGFHIDQQTKETISYDHIKKVYYVYDRPAYSPIFSWGQPSAKSYRLTIELNDGSAKTLYPEKEAAFGYRRVHGDFNDAMKKLRKTNHYLYKRIITLDWTK